MHDEAHTLRLGYPDRANYLPLTYPLVAGWAALDAPWTLEPVSGFTSRLVELLAEGELDAAFVPPAVIARGEAGLSALGGWGFACEGRVETAVLLAPNRLDQIEDGEIVLLPESAGSSAEHLLRVLMKPYYDVGLRLATPDESRAGNDAGRLVFSDSGPREASARSEPWVAEDLGVAWYVFTGAPMVWELLASSRGLEERKPGASAAIQSALERSRAVARQQDATIVALAQDRTGLPREAIKALCERQRYTLSGPEQKGLAKFLDMAARAGVL
jgi:predicted solute-binding protein